MMNQCPRMFCFGLGYVGLRLVRKLQVQGWSVAGTTRCEERYHELAQEGIETHFFRQGHASEQIDNMLAGTTHILVTVPPGANGDDVFNECRNAISVLPELQWLGYLSSTSVYGDHGGAWVDETAQTKADNDKAVRRLKAEKSWLSLHESHNVPTHIFRLAGIYGPERSAINRVRDRTAPCIVKDGHVFSRVHLADIIRVLMASIKRPAPGEIYNVADDEPAPLEDITRFAAQLLDVPLPKPEPFETAEMSDMMRSFFMANKKVSNNKIKKELGVKLAYPDYRKGLRAILSSEA